jgi:hypothetical protein
MIARIDSFPLDDSFTGCLKGEQLMSIQLCRKREVACALFLGLMCLLSPQAVCREAVGGDAAALLEKTGLKGGLCLVVGAKDESLAVALVKGSGLYAQVLQPDAKVASQLGGTFAVADYRENIGLRVAEFNPEHYGSNLFNLIVVEDAVALGKAKLADLLRITVPNGHVALKGLAGGFAEEAQALKLGAQSMGSFQAVLKKPLSPVEWKVCDSLLWRAGPRAQDCNSFSQFSVKDGMFSYVELMEVPGDVNTYRPQLFVRDAYNGRTIKTEEQPDSKNVFSSVAEAKTLGKKKPAETVEMPKFGNSCFTPFKVGDYFVYHHNIWVNLKTQERVFPHLVHPACFMGQVLGAGILYNVPSRKNGCVAGITAIGPADIKFDHEPGGKALQKFEAPPAGEATGESDWTMFRGNASRGNSTKASPGEKLENAWEVSLSMGGKSYGVMSGQRTGLTQPVSAYGLVYVSDIDAQRIVALNVADGKQKWVFHVGSRVDFSPAIYNGMCLVAAKDGWVYGLNAKTGALVWRLLVTSQERYIGGQEKLESLWPTRGDVLVANGVGYAAAGFGFTVLGGARAVAFKPETGELIWGQCYHAELTKAERQAVADILQTAPGSPTPLMAGMALDPKTGATDQKVKKAGGTLQVEKTALDDYLVCGNSLERNNADRNALLMSDGKIEGRMIAFSSELSVAYVLGRDKPLARKNYGGEMNLVAAKAAKAELWKSPAIELVPDDIVITPQYVYCAGHYAREKKGSELWVISPADGKILSTLPVEGFPAFGGMSVTGDNVFVATREGKLICFRAAK